MRHAHLPSFHGHDVNVIVETPRGSRAKYSYDPETGLFVLGKLLPRGLAFPMNFGFVPSTAGGDGDPMDALVVTDEAIPQGSLVRCRLLGVLETQKTKEGRRVKDDRLVVAPAVEGSDRPDRLQDLGTELDDIEQFLIAYNRARKKPFRILGRGGAKRALELLKAALR